MGKQTRISIFVAVLLAATSVVSLTGCQSKPVLKQVESDAPDKAINTPEIAAQLKEKYEK